MRLDRPKLCFVLPEYSDKTHFRYVAEFAETLQEHADVYLVQEKGSDELRGKFTRFYRQRMRFGALRALENFFALLGARLSGYRTIYIHYSFVSALHAGVITKVLGGTVYYWNCGMPWQYERGGMREWYERLAYRMIDHLVTGAPALVPEYARYYGLDPASVIVIPNWVEPASPSTDALRAVVRRDIAASAGARVLLFVHRLAKRKGAHHLPDLARLLRDEQVVLAVVGGGPERDAVALRCRELGVEDQVRLLGERDKAYVDAALQCADLFIMPSEEEGSPHALLEAMAAGVPFVAFDVGGVRDTAPPGCGEYVVPSNDLESFVARLRTLLSDCSEYTRVQEEEKKWIAGFRLGRVVDRFREAILVSSR